MLVSFEYIDNLPCTYPAADIADAALPLPFREREGDEAGNFADSEVFCLFGRREARDGSDFASGGAGLGSRAGALRFRDEAGCRGWVGVATAEEEAEAADSKAARAADARVVLGDMSIYLWMMFSHSFARLWLLSSDDNKDWMFTYYGIQS